MNSDIVLQVQELKKYFGSVCAVDGVSFSVQRGQVYGFLGPNGSGKTTTIGMILGLLYPTSGTVSLFGEVVTPVKTSPMRRVGALVGSPALLPYLSAIQNLDLLRRLNPDIPLERTDEVLKLVGLEGDAQRRAGIFSTGMKQRLGIAMSLLHKPDLLILDEPTNGMDPAGMFEIRNILTRLSEQDVTIFISSHLLHEVEQICDRVAVLKHGKIIAEGDVAGLIGDSETVKVKVRSPHKAVQILRQLPDCREIRTNGTYVTLSGLPSERVVALLVAKGIIPTEVKMVHLDLEHIYLQLTNGEPKEVKGVLEPIMD